MLVVFEIISLKCRREINKNPDGTTARHDEDCVTSPAEDRNSQQGYGITHWELELVNYQNDKKSDDVVVDAATAEAIIKKNLARGGLKLGTLHTPFNPSFAHLL